MEIVGGFLNSIIDADCTCKASYKLPFKEGEYFDVVVKNRENPAILDGFSWEIIDTQGVFEVIRFTPIEGDLQGSITFGEINTLQSLCEAPSIQSLCGDPLASFCGEVFDFGVSCFSLSNCFDMLLEYELKFSWGWVQLRQRLPIFYTNMQPKTNNVKVYQSTSGVARRVGRLQTYYEYTLKTDLVTDEFHKMLNQILLQGRNIKINGKDFDFAGDYDIKTEQDDFCLRMATCKLIEKAGLQLNCE